MSTKSASQSVRSADGTRIAFDRSGPGSGQGSGSAPPVILVDPAGHDREFSVFDGLAAQLARELTVYRYDRRGRGESTDTAPYAPDREVEDLGALIAEAGGSAAVYGFSSGALLAMHGAARGLPIRALALLEPPLQDDAAPRPSALTQELEALIAAGRRSDAVDHFHATIGVPPEIVAQMRAGAAWPKLVSIAHTLVYDCMIADATTSGLLRGVAVPALVLDSAGSTDNLTGWAASVARQLPSATHRSLPGGWHGIADDVLAPVLIDFFRTAAQG